MLHRYPDGIDGEKIYQKRLPKGAPEWVETVEVRFPSGRTADELCVTELAAVAWAVQMSTVEFHPWHSRRADTEKPDEWRIDLDPARHRTCAVQSGRRGRARGAGRVRRGRLAEDVRVARVCTSTSASSRASASARCAAPRSRSRVRSNGARRSSSPPQWWKEERGDSAVFIDYNQNARDRTIAAAYSVRGRRGPGVGAGHVGRVARRRDGRLHDRDDAGALRRTGRPARRHRRRGVVIEPLLEWADRDEHDRGLGDMPYPPNYPKRGSRRACSRRRRSSRTGTTRATASTAEYAAGRRLHVWPSKVTPTWPPAN